MSILCQESPRFSPSFEWDYRRDAEGSKAGRGLREPPGLRIVPTGCIYRRMPRMQVYLPEAMYRQVKARGLPVPELLQKAVEAEMRRLDLLAETDRYLDDLLADIGEPTPAQRSRAEATARRLARRSIHKAG